MKTIYKEEDINLETSIIFNLINDIDRYPEFLPWCTKTEVLNKTKNTLTGKIYISKSLMKWDFTTNNIIDKNKTITLMLVDGPFEMLDGQWSFTSLDKNNTRVCLKINYKFKNLIIELSIEPIFKTIMNSILNSFIEQAFKDKYDD